MSEQLVVHLAKQLSYTCLKMDLGLFNLHLVLLFLLHFVMQ